MGKGRKTKYRKEYPDLIRAEKAVGKTDKEIAAQLGVRPQTLCEWREAKDKDGKPRYPELAEALETKKEIVVGNLRNSLIKRALGYEITEEKVITLRTKKGNVVQRVEKTIKHVPASDIAIFKALDALDHDNFPRNTDGTIQNSKGALMELFERMKADDTANGKSGAGS